MTRMRVLWTRRPPVRRGGIQTRRRDVSMPFSATHARRSVWYLLLASFLIVPLLLSSCGGNDPSPTPQPQTTRVTGQTELATPEASPIVVKATPRAGATPAASPEAVGGESAACGGTGGTAPSKAETKGFAPNGLGIVVVGALNLRSGPGTDCPVVGSMGFGTTVHLKGPFVKRGGHIWRYLKGPEGAGFAAADAIQAMPDKQPATVPILMYHHINSPPSRYFVSAWGLDKEMKWLKDHGYVSITPTDLYNALYKDLPLPAKPIIISIDDGNDSTMDFEKILTKYGFRGTYFLPNVSAISADQIRQLDASGGEICGHTVTHPDLSKLDYDAQEQEIGPNKIWLEGIVGHPVTCFAYPFGAYSKATAEIVADAGYKLAFNAWGPPAPLDPDNEWHIPRIEVDGGITMDTFIGYLTYGN